MSSAGNKERIVFYISRQAASPRWLLYVHLPIYLALAALFLITPQGVRIDWICGFAFGWGIAFYAHVLAIIGLGFFFNPQS